MSYAPPGLLPAHAVAATGVAAAAAFLPQLAEYPRYLLTFALAIYDRFRVREKPPGEAGEAGGGDAGCGEA